MRKPERGLGIQERYLVTDLAQAAGVTTETVVAWLRARGARMTPRRPTQRRPGSITFNALMDAMPELAELVAEKLSPPPRCSIL